MSFLMYEPSGLNVCHLQSAAHKAKWHQVELWGDQAMRTEPRTNGVYVFINGLEETALPLYEDRVCHLVGTILKQRTGFSKQQACGILLLGLQTQIYKSKFLCFITP